MANHGPLIVYEISPKGQNGADASYPDETGANQFQNLTQFRADRMCVVIGAQPVTIQIWTDGGPSTTVIPANSPPYDVPRPWGVNIRSAATFTLQLYNVVDYDRLLDGLVERLDARLVEGLFTRLDALLERR